MPELAPYHKLGLCLSNPVMTSSGFFGYGVEYTELVHVQALGAVVTNPVTLRPQRAGSQPRLAEAAGSIVLATRAENPGVRRVIQRYSAAWQRLGVPVIVHLADKDPSDLARTATALEATSSVAGFELGLADDISAGGLADLVEAVWQTELPLLVRLPFCRAVELAPACEEAGVDALVLSGPPPAAVRHSSGKIVSGRLHGPALHALTLQLLLELRPHLALPLVACGGIHSTTDARVLLEAGADAVQIDSAILVDPGIIETVAAGLS